jgi:hypothetical protein
MIYFGGCNSREVSHSFMLDAISACRARLKRRSRSMPGGVAPGLLAELFSLVGEAIFK